MNEESIYGRWVVVGKAPNKLREKMLRCRCACGTERDVSLRNLQAGTSVSCGCYKSEVMAAKFTTHGRSKTLLYRAWMGMLERCEKPSHKSYAYYGGRGITVCKRWHKFEHFLADMGERPQGLSLERRNNARGYMPSNCYWATRSEQMQNIRTTRMLTVNGTTLPARAWAERVGISLHGLLTRIDKYGWSVQRACTTGHQRKHKE